MIDVFISTLISFREYQCSMENNINNLSAKIGGLNNLLHRILFLESFVTFY